MKRARRWTWLIAVIMMMVLPPVWGAPPAVQDKTAQAVISGYLENVTFEKLPGKERVNLTVSRQSGVTVENQPGNALLVRLENLFVPEGLRRPLDDPSLANVIRVTPVQKTEGGRSWVLATIELKQKVPYSVRQEGMNVLIDFNVTSLASAAGYEPAKPLPSVPLPDMRQTAPTPARGEAKGPGKEQKVYTGSRISLDVQDARIDGLFRLLSEQGNVNIVAGEDVIKVKEDKFRTVTLNMKNVPWEEALDTILAIHNLYKVINNNVIMVMSQDSFTKLKKAEEDLARRNQMELDREPLLTRIVPIRYRMLKYAAAAARQEQKIDFKKDILLGSTSGETTAGAADRLPGSRPADGSAPLSGANMQQTRLYAAAGAPGGAAAAKAGDEKKIEDTYFIHFLQNYLSRDAEGKRRGWIAADADTNSVIITAIQRDLDVILDMIAKTDIPTDQVLIKANIIETTKSMARSVGIQWGGVLGRTLGSQSMYLTPGGTEGSATPPGSVLTGGYTPKYGTEPGIGGQGYGVNFPASVIGGTAPGSLGLIFGTIGGNVLELQLSALQSEGKLNILSSPSLVTLDNQTASTENGNDVPYVNPPTQDSPATVTWKKVVLRLDITPHVIDKKNIKMTIGVKKDELDESSTLCVVISGYRQCPIFVKETKTDLVVADGETIVISGLTKQKQGGGTTGVPWLKDIPVLGWLFKGDEKTEAMEEVLIFITPSLIKSQEITDIQTGA